MMLDYDIESSELGSDEFNTLSNIASTLGVGMQDTAVHLAAYEDQLRFIMRLLKPYDHTVLQGLASILSEGIEKLVDEKRQLNIDECIFLKKIPDILSEYAFIPTSKIPDAHLLTHFKNPQWIRPVSANEEKEFIKFLIEGSSGKSVNNDPELSVNVVESAQAIVSDIEENADEPEINLSELLTLKSNENLLDAEVMEADIDASIDMKSDAEFEILEDPEIILSKKEEAVLSGQAESIEEDNAEILDLTSFLSGETGGISNDIDLTDSPDEADVVINADGCSEDQVLDLSEFMKKPDEAEEFDEQPSQDEFDSEVNLLDMIDFSETEEQENKESEVNELSEAIESENKTQDITVTDDSFDEDTGISFSISPEQQELVKLIGDELEDIISDKDLTTIKQSAEISEQKEQLITIAEQAENISNAIDLIGLEGLGNSSRSISGNIHSLASSDRGLSAQQAQLIETWPVVILSYLNDISGEQSSDNLINYLKDDAWPRPINNKAEASLISLLKAPQMEEEEKTLRQSVANADDMSLQLPDDVNPELLEGLLQDLPVQSGEFSIAVQNLQEQKDMEYLEVAQRIAHTLKGAGNVVGVKGIANLTHHLEDILEIQSKANKLPSRQLLEILVDASDCLETMTEALLGIDEPPDNGVSIYQLVLDWANKLDHEGATEYSDEEEQADFVGSTTAVEKELSDTGITTVSENKNSQQTEPSELKKPINIENMLRVPAKLADDLLRLAGENLISTSQIQEYIKIIQNRYKNLKVHDQTLQKLAFDLEHIVDVQGIASSNVKESIDDGFDPLELDQYHELHTMSRRLVEISADSIELTQDLENDFAELQNLVVNQDKLQKENEELVLRTRMVPTNTIIPRLKRGVKQACRLTGKQVELDVVDNETYMDSEVLNGLIEPLMHVLRNAVDHGIETSEERRASGKDNKGLIKLNFSRRGDQIVIDVQDDGKGLDLQKIRSKAISMGMAESENEITESNLQKYILHPGFSTRTEVSQVSGRGIGLDVVNSKIRELKGSIQISSEKDRGCLFSLTLPISSFSVHSLLVRVRENVYALSNRGIEEILYPGLGEIQEIGKEAMYKLGDDFYNISLVETLLNLPGDRRDVDRTTRPVILLKDDSGTRTAILVQDVLDSRDVVVKSMGPYMPKIPGVVGATVLGDGSIAPVIDLPELILSVKSLNGEIRYHRQEPETQAPAKLPYVLVVDDSLSARKSLAQFVEDLGLDVRTARDGMEAVSLIDVRKPDLILVDMEMPRMNGLELTSHIRASSETQDMPVIMITSRSTDKHRKAAMDKGVDHYMVKPFEEDELASHINLALRIA